MKGRAKKREEEKEKSRRFKVRRCTRRNVGSKRRKSEKIWRIKRTVRNKRGEIKRTRNRR
jgi:hypothetical protein